jgi:hypothetical protein
VSFVSTEAHRTLHNTCYMLHVLSRSTVNLRRAPPPSVLIGQQRPILDHSRPLVTTRSGQSDLSSALTKGTVKFYSTAWSSNSLIYLFICVSRHRHLPLFQTLTVRRPLYMKHTFSTTRCAAACIAGLKFLIRTWPQTEMHVPVTLKEPLYSSDSKGSAGDFGKDWEERELTCFFRRGQQIHR